MKTRRILSLLIALVALAIGAAVVVLVEFPSSHPSDSVLSRNLSDQEARFNQLVKMATEDSTALAVHPSYVCLKNTDGWPPYIYLYEDKPWPRTEAEVGFSKGRWDAYRSMFRDLNLKMGVSRHEDMPDAIFFTASFDSSEIDETETAITEKGYVYSRKEINTSLSSLGGLEINRPAIFYRKLNRDWYLYYEWSVSKPE